MKEHWKKGLSFLLSLILMLSMASFTIYADAPDATSKLKNVSLL